MYKLNDEILNNMEIVNDFWFEKLSFCGCGDPYSQLRLIKGVLNVVYNFHENKDNDFNLNGIDKTMFEFIMYTLDTVEVIEHGSVITYGWLTEYGEKLRNALNELTDEQLNDFMIVNN